MNQVFEKPIKSYFRGTAMKYRIVADSSCNLYSFEGVDFSSVPLKIVTDKKEYVDAPGLDVERMIGELAAYKGRSGTACPNMAEWLDAFGQAEGIFAIAITSSLSGSYNACVQAKAEYEQNYPGRKVCCLDSLSAGPELLLIMEKLRELISMGLEFEEIERRIRRYMQHTHLVFLLEKVDNLAKNGRISPLAAKTVGVLGIRIMGKASDEGTLQQLHKCRGEGRGLRAMLKEMELMGYRGGKVRIAHGLNQAASMELERSIKGQFPQADVGIGDFTGLCAFYGEEGCIMLGFEDSEA